MTKEKNIIIIGARGYQFQYGGWETFVTELVKNNRDENIKFYIPNLTHDKSLHKQEKYTNGVHNPTIYCKDRDFVTMFVMTIKSTLYYMKYIKKHKLKNVIIYNLGCKVGPLYLFWRPILKLRKVKLIINPDGLEWKREKWAWWIKICFKISEMFYVMFTDHVICDAKAIQDYINSEYKIFKKPSTFIPYGAYFQEVKEKNKIADEIMKKYKIKKDQYYLIVGRFVPENNYETMIKEFMKSKTKKDLIIISNVEENNFYKYLKETTKFESDPRIKFIGTVYDSDALTYIRKNAYGYIHGHSAGGTNPSLVEALSITDLNLLFDVCYNKEVGESAAYYYTKEEGSLSKLINKVDKISKKEKEELSQLAKQRIIDVYNWPNIVEKHQEVFNDLLQ